MFTVKSEEILLMVTCLKLVLISQSNYPFPCDVMAAIGNLP